MGTSTATPPRLRLSGGRNQVHDFFVAHSAATPHASATHRKTPRFENFTADIDLPELALCVGSVATENHQIVDDRPATRSNTETEFRG